MIHGFMDDGLIWLRNAVSCMPFRVLPGRNGAIILAYIGKILQLTTVVEFARLARYGFLGKIAWGASRCWHASKNCPQGNSIKVVYTKPHHILLKHD